MIVSRPGQTCYLEAFTQFLKCCNPAVFVAEIIEGFNLESSVVLLTKQLKLEADYYTISFTNNTPENLSIGTIDLKPGTYNFKIYGANAYQDSVTGLVLCYEDILFVPFPDNFVSP